ncbi:MAG: glycosyltransferase [Calothrix sp. MO_167.B12]|nr:glycosyltransferase [Calothrix sp. MO_167.B12]
MKILFLTTILLSQGRNGSEVGTQCFIDGLKECGHQVSVLGYLRKGDYLEKTDPSVFVVSERYVETKLSKTSALFWMFLSFLSGLPYSSVKYYSKEYVGMVKELLAKDNYDLIIIDHPQLCWLEHLVQEKDKLVTISHNLEHKLYLETAEKARNFISKFIYSREAHLIKIQENKLATTVKQVWTVTENDAKYFSNLEGGAKAIAFTQPPASEKLLDKPLNKEFDIGLLGSWTWRANEEALQWFLEKIHPLLPPNLSIHIAGKGADWLNGKYSNICYRGVVPDAQEFMAQAKVVAIPTLSGGGIQIKTLDAIASGSLIVATPVAIRGISQPPSTITVADNPEKFAQYLISAVTLSSTLHNFDDAKDWYRARRDKFFNDIDDAIQDMSTALRKPKIISSPLKQPLLRP